MMAQLRRTNLVESKVETIANNLLVAGDFWSRSKGLLGHATLPEGEAMWIHRCNSIHTFFMKFSIDCVFLDQKMVVKKIYTNVPPWRLIWPVWGASSVIEMSAGQVAKYSLKQGEQLNVVT